MARGGSHMDTLSLLISNDTRLICLFSATHAIRDPSRLQDITRVAELSADGSVTSVDFLWMGAIDTVLTPEDGRFTERVTHLT